MPQTAVSLIELSVLGQPCAIEPDEPVDDTVPATLYVGEQYFECRSAFGVNIHETGISRPDRLCPVGWHRSGPRKALAANPIRRFGGSSDSGLRAFGVGDVRGPGTAVCRGEAIEASGKVGIGDEDVLQLLGDVDGARLRVDLHEHTNLIAAGDLCIGLKVARHRHAIHTLALAHCAGEAHAFDRAPDLRPL